MSITVVQPRGTTGLVRVGFATRSGQVVPFPDFIVPELRNHLDVLGQSAILVFELHGGLRRRVHLRPPP
jgi:hypothetical protein